MIIAGPVWRCGKAERCWRGFSKLLWKSWFQDFHQQRRLPQVSVFFLSGKNSFPGSPRIDDRGSAGPSGRGFFRGFLLPGPMPRFLPFLQGTPEPVGLDSRLDDVGAICDPVQQRLAQPDVGKHLGPLRKGQIRGQDHRRPLGAIRDDLEKQFGTQICQRHVADFVDRDQFVPEPPSQSAPELVVVLGFDQLVDQAGGGREARPLISLLSVGPLLIV